MTRDLAKRVALAWGGPLFTNHELSLLGGPTRLWSAARKAVWSGEGVLDSDVSQEARAPNPYLPWFFFVFCFLFFFFAMPTPLRSFRGQG